MSDSAFSELSAKRQNVWRYTAISILVGGVVDARCNLAFIPFLLHMSLNTLYFCLSVFVFFGVLTFFKLTPESLVRLIVSSIRGRVRQATPWWRKRLVYRRF